MLRAMLSALLAASVLACGSGSPTRDPFSPGSGLPGGSNPTAPRALATAPSLGAAASFSVLGGQTVTNTGPTTLAGDLGVSPGSAITGFPPGLALGTTHKADAVALQAQNDTTNAFNLLSGAPCDTDLTGQDLAGKTLVAGVYCFTSDALLTGTVTLNAQNDPAAVFIFKIDSKLTAASASSVSLINGANPCNVFWKVGSSATIGTSSMFKGTIVALTSIALQTTATLAGRALARNGEVTLDSNQVTGACAAAATDGGSSDAGSGQDGGADAGPADGGGADAGGGGVDAGTGSGGVTQCKGVCTDLDLDANNCGACGFRCSDSQVCRAGACGPCPAQDTQCKEQCADLKNDNDNCGACGHVCPGATSCKNGVCGACDGTVCGNSCVWLDIDSNNCGACGKVCGADQCCVNSQCTGNAAGSGKTCGKH